MTQPQQPQQPRLAVTAAPGSRLEELLAAYDSTKAAAEEAESRHKAVTDGIKAELSGAYPGVADITLAGAPGMPALRMTWKAPWRFNTKQFKEDNPVLYVRYASQGGNWDLRAL